MINWILCSYPNVEWPFFRRVCYHVFKNAIPIEVHGKENLERMIREKKRVLYVLEPHGIVPIGALFLGLYIDHYYPQLYPYIFVATVLTKLPIFRQIYIWLGCIPAKKKMIERTIQTTERNMCILPGGVAEIFTSNKDSDVLYLKRRKGFIKIALKYNLYICPIYLFGNNDLYKHDLREGSIEERVSRRFQVPILYFRGRWGLPMIPFKTKIHIAIGEPFKLRKPKGYKKRYNRVVNIAHSEFIRQITKLYNKYKDRIDYNKQLIIK